MGVNLKRFIKVPYLGRCRLKKKIVLILSATVVFLGVLSCGGDDGSSYPTTTTTFEGTIAGTNDTEAGKQTGTISVTITPVVSATEVSADAASGMTATGTINLAGGRSITLTGSYDSSTGDLDLTGDDGFSLTGSLDNNLMDGDYTGTDDDTGGGFAGLNFTNNPDVKVFCGTFTGGSGGSTGLFNIVVTATKVSGVRINYSSRHEYRTIKGERTGDSITAEIDDTGRMGEGTITGDTVAGTFINKEGNPGEFHGSVSECQ